MKDNYSWLDDCLDNFMNEVFRIGKFYEKPTPATLGDRSKARYSSKQTIISQIEIEKLRAIREQRADAIKSYKKILKLEQAELQAQAKKDK
jgi:hypothetical protein